MKKNAAVNRCRHGRSLPKSAHRAGVSVLFTGIGLTSHSGRLRQSGRLNSSARSCFYTVA